MNRGKIVLYDFINDDADFKDSDKDFNNHAIQAQQQQNRGKGNFMNRMTQMHPQAIRDDEIGLKEWLYDAKVMRVPIH